MVDPSPNSDARISDTPLAVHVPDEDTNGQETVQKTADVDNIPNAVDTTCITDAPAPIEIPHDEASTAIGKDEPEKPLVSSNIIEHEEPKRNKERQTEPALPLLSLPIAKQGLFTSFRKKHKSLALVLLILLLLGIVAPLIVAGIYGVQGYMTYQRLKSDANSGVQHLLNIKNLLSSGSNAKTSSATSSMSITEKLMDARTLAEVRSQLSAAKSDFTHVNLLIDHTALIGLLTQYQPKYRTEVASARAASQIGVDVADVGQVVLSSVQVLLPKLRGPLLNESNTPLITSSDLTLIGDTIDKVLPYINDIELQSYQMSLDSLPLSTHEREQISQLLPLLPQVQAALVQGKSLLGAVGWLLGVDSPRTFLVQTMDRAELRATGGFTGQYGELHIAGGRVAPFSLRDISLVEYADNSPTTDKVPPAAYRSWWPFANWGLRDSNLSADFPTSAQLAITQYKKEVHRQVDGVILFTPFLIEQVLQVTGPIYIPLYNETITSQNLESRLHYYQLDNAGIKKQIELQGNNSSTSQRKEFTSLVAHTLMDTVRHASVTTLLALGRQMLHAMQTKDLQVYVTNSQLENLLAQHGYAAQIDRSTTHDGLYVVQTNVSASKASQYVRTVLRDTVTLDSSGGATHFMQMQLEYNELGLIYGYDTYRDYVRVYVPPSSKLLSGDGFDTGQPLCGGYYSTCPQQNVYAGNELVCPSGLYEPGAAAPSPIDPDGANYLPLDKLGGPTNTTSDEPGRAMFAGYVVIPKNCTMMVTLSWYVPPMGQTGVGEPGSVGEGTGHVVGGAGRNELRPYELLVQRQAGTFPEINLTILPTPNDCTSLATQGLYVDRVLDEDTAFTLPLIHNANNTHCYAQPNL